MGKLSAFVEDVHIQVLEVVALVVEFLLMNLMEKPAVLVELVHNEIQLWKVLLALCYSLLKPIVSEELFHNEIQMVIAVVVLVVSLTPIGPR